MKNNLKNLILLFSILLLSCSNSTKLIHKNTTPYGKVNFYANYSQKNKDSIVRIYAAVDSIGYKIYYDFYPNELIKRRETDKQTYYNAYYGKLSENFDSNIYEKFNLIDSIVLADGDMLIDSLHYTNLKKAKGAEAFIGIIVYYHGWPKNKKFKP